MMPASASLTNTPTQGVISAVKRASSSTGMITGQVVGLAHRHVVGAEGGRDVHDAGALVGGHEVGRRSRASTACRA